MGKSTISWTIDTWNPFMGCRILTSGCTNCYAMVRAHEIVEDAARGGRDAAGSKYAGLTKVVNGRPVWNGMARVAGPDVLAMPIRWTRPRLIFVNSMSDLFYEGFRDEDIFSVFDVMMQADQHVYQVLTKRHARMLALTDAYLEGRGLARFEHIQFGVTAENQDALDARGPVLEKVRARTRFLSMEPLIGRIDPSTIPAVEQVIVGGESIDKVARAAGQHARPFDIKWPREILPACRERGIAFHMKQLGESPIGVDRLTPKGDRIEDLPVDLQVREYPPATLERFPALAAAA